MANRSGNGGGDGKGRVVVITGASAGVGRATVRVQLSRHPGVSQAFAVGVADERWGEIGVACVVPKAGMAVSADDLIALCRDQLARFKVPRRVVFLEAAELPTTPTGKVQKYKLARMVAETQPA